MSCELECRTCYPEVSTIRTKSESSSGDTESNFVSFKLKPVEVRRMRAIFNKELMKVGKWYSFQIQKQTYVAVKTSKAVIDVYRVRK
jgi:hypothetical protein